MIRCKLISPTNLLLEHPMLSPLKETEFVVHGRKEFEKVFLNRFLLGLYLGALTSMLVSFLVVLIFDAVHKGSL